MPYGDGLVSAARAVAPEGFDIALDYVGGAAMDATAVEPRARTEHGGQYVWVRPDSQGLAELAGLVATGELRLDVSSVDDLEHAADAYRELEGDHTRGKIVVRVDDEVSRA